MSKETETLKTWSMKFEKETKILLRTRLGTFLFGIMVKNLTVFNLSPEIFSEAELKSNGIISKEMSKQYIIQAVAWLLSSILWIYIERAKGKKCGQL